MIIDNNHIEVLLVEDNPSDVELTLRALKKYHFANKVFVVNDGEEALDFIYCKGKYEKNSMENIKFILLDLKLPKVDGLEVLRTLKADKKTKSIPVVVLTSSKEDEGLIECYELGVNSYIVKPLDFSQFMKAIGEIGMYWLLVNERPLK